MAHDDTFDIATLKKTESYDVHPLQTVDVYRLSLLPSALWVVFIHGGAWRDPLITSSAAAPLFQHLVSSPLLPNTNYASLSYRLSPHPDHPNPDNTAQHPDHLTDVLAALAHLRTHHALSRFVLVGHSAGATLAFQSLPALSLSATLTPPLAIFGIEGIYDLPDLIAEYPSYRSFVSGAFGDDTDTWPQVGQDAAGYRGLVVLCHSDEDELLSWRQTEGMKEVVEERLGPSMRGGGGVRVVKLGGGHDEVLLGERLAGVVGRYVKEL
ncbi:Alpha/Beta hydrolase protein [Geopyxis carbonaria]|nr:Alpha/Beta hydrolase protein [Geopyxis carbonaria]